MCMIAKKTLYISIPTIKSLYLKTFLVMCLQFHFKSKLYWSCGYEDNKHKKRFLDYGKVFLSLICLSHMAREPRHEIPWEMCFEMLEEKFGDLSLLDLRGGSELLNLWLKAGIRLPCFGLIELV